MKISTCVIKFGTLVPTEVERRKLLVLVRCVDVFYLCCSVLTLDVFFTCVLVQIVLLLVVYLCFSTNYTCVGRILVF